MDLACLIVSDNARTRDLLENTLFGCGVAVMCCECICSIEAIVIGLRPEIVILDAGIRRPDALDALRCLASLRYAGAVQVTGDQDRYLLSEIHRIGSERGLRMAPVLARPMAADPLVHLVRREQERCKQTPRALSIGGEAGQPAMPALLHRAWFTPKDWSSGHVDLSLAGVACPDGQGSHITQPSVREQVATMIAFQGHYARSIERLEVPVSLLVRGRIAEFEGGIFESLSEVVSRRICTIMACFDEADIFADLARASEAILRLRIRGIEVRVENVGSRYFSLAGYRGFPVHQATIRSFLRREESAAAARRLRVINDMARRCGTVVLAEDVPETAERDWYVEAGFSLCQRQRPGWQPLALTPMTGTGGRRPASLDWQPVALNLLYRQL